MRQIEKQMLKAVKNGSSMVVGNTQVVQGDGYCDVFLHGNHIARIFTDGRGEFTLAGWDTPTTRSRLNALGVGVYHKKKQPVFSGMVILYNEWYAFNFDK